MTDDIILCRVPGWLLSRPRRGGDARWERYRGDRHQGDRAPNQPHRPLGSAALTALGEADPTVQAEASAQIAATLARMRAAMAGRGITAQRPPLRLVQEAAGPEQHHRDSQQEGRP